MSRNPDYPIHPQFIERWSPRSFTGEPIAREELFALFEAARWAPSANNSQPWRFVYTTRDSKDWSAFLDLLIESNQRWAGRASALIVLLSKTSQQRPGNDQPTPLFSHTLDAGAAWGNLALQAEHSGWRSHAIGGFDRERARQLLGVPDGYKVEIAIAIGRQADRSYLPESLQEREHPNQRQPLSALVAEGRFAFDEA
jgi:nitroreductase